MNNKIKVWVAVDKNGRELPCSTGAAIDEAVINAAKAFGPRGNTVSSADRARVKWLKEQGWTVQPYTLVKGHDHD